MKVFYLFLFLVILNHNLSNAQNIQKKQKSVLDKGLSLFEKERVSWLTSDYLQEKIDISKIEDFRGYITYEENEILKSIYLQGTERLRVFYTFEFKGKIAINEAIIDDKIRNPSELELKLINIRKKVQEEILTNSEITTYDKVNFNLVFESNKKGIIVYLLSSTPSYGLVLLGNDYKVYFTQTGKFIKTEKIHKNLIPVEWQHKDEQTEEISIATSSFHSHLSSTGELITETDICTMLLYGPQNKGHQHYVIGKKYVSILKLDERELYIMKKKVFDKLMSREKN